MLFCLCLFCFSYVFLHNLEQLERVEGGLDNIQVGMREAEKHLKGMEKWCGMCVCPWNRLKITFLTLKKLTFGSCARGKAIFK